MTRRLIVADRIVTASGRQGDSILIADGLVEALGSAAELGDPALPEQRYPGGVIIPGLRDAHFHPIVYAAVLGRLTVKDAYDIPDLLGRVRAASDRLRRGQPLIGARLDDEALEEQRLPTRHDLDSAVRDRPVVIHRYCGHVAVANTTALEAAGIGPDTADPPGGSFDRDETGSPTGVLRETAVSFISREVGSRSSGIGGEQVLEAFRGLAKLGLTSVGAIVSLEFDPWCGEAGELESLLAAAADLPIKARVLVIAKTEQEITEAAERLENAGPRVGFLGFKAFGDGGLGAHTAALREPYEDLPSETGMLRLDHNWAVHMGKAALALGGKVAIHAIGDLANERVLDAFEQLLQEGADPRDLRVEHASVLREGDVARFAQLGVTASVQPAFLPSETEWLLKRVGPDRMRHTYPFATLLDAGVPLAGGSDCPVEPPSPLWGMGAARDRAGLVPEEGLSPGQALALFTDGAAAALGEEAPLAPGSPADFVVLDRDPLAVDPVSLRNAEVLATWVDGQPVDLPAEPPDWPG